MPRFLPCICMALGLLACNAEPTSSVPNDEALLGEADGGGLVDVASNRPIDDVPDPTVHDGNATLTDTDGAEANDADKREAEVTQGDFSYGDDMVVGEGACTND